MPSIFLAIDWNALGQGGIATLVVTAVFVIIVKPLVSQIIKSNDKLADSVAKLNDTISNGDRTINDAIKESEQRIVDRFTSTIEGNTVTRENVKELKDSLKRVEEKLSR